MCRPVHIGREGSSQSDHYRSHYYEELAVALGFALVGDLLPISS